MKKQPFLLRILHPPHYNFSQVASFYRPLKIELLREFFSRLNPLSDKFIWLALLNWLAMFILLPVVYLFFSEYFSWPLFIISFVYGNIVMNVHSTVYLHRYCSHRAFKFSHPMWLFIVRNAVVKMVAEETYAVSHVVHHAHPDKAGDPYNAKGGWLYCFIADVNHQIISKNLCPADYKKVTGLIKHSGVKLNSYRQYQRFGSLCSPWRAVIHFLLNWLFWASVLYMLGGIALVVAVFSGALCWAVCIRNFNYIGHGLGKDRRRKGVEFNYNDLSLNQCFSGYLAGEWHNNHHLYPHGARSGFLPYQIDLAWVMIFLLKKIRWVYAVNDPKADFIKKYNR